MIDPNRFTFEFEYDILYHKHYRQYDRVLIQTDVSTRYGKIQLMISQRYTPFIIHIHIGNYIWFKFHLSPRTYKRLNADIKQWIRKDYTKIQYRCDYLRTKKLAPNTFYLYLDKMIDECKLSEWQVKSIMRFIDAEYRGNHYFLLKALSLPFKDDYKISKEREQLLKFVPQYLWETPSIVNYESKLDLINYKYHDINYYVCKARIPYEDFLETIQDLTDNEVEELVANYRTLSERDYGKDIRYMYYRLAESMHVKSDDIMKL